MAAKILVRVFLSLFIGKYKEQTQDILFFQKEKSIKSNKKINQNVKSHQNRTLNIREY